MTDPLETMSPGDRVTNGKHRYQVTRRREGRDGYAVYWLAGQFVTFGPLAIETMEMSGYRKEVAI